MLYELFIAKRYLRTKRKAKFISLNTWFSVGGVMIGVAALIIVLSVMNGFEREVRERIIGTDAHISVIQFDNRGISSYDSLAGAFRKDKEIVGASPYIHWQAMATSGKRTEGCMVKGIDPATINEVTDLKRNMILGELNLEEVPNEEGKMLPGIVLGTHLADAMRTRPGQEVILMSAKGLNMSSFFTTPKMGKFVVTGLFETGMYEYDASLSYISIPAAQDLFNMKGEVTGIGLKTTDMFAVGETGERLRKELGYPYYTLSWIESHRSLFNWMTIEKWAMFITLCLIILVAAFNIISTLIMVVMEKSAEIGILRSMGARRGSIMLIFTLQGLLVGVIGTLGGSLIGFVLCFIQQKYQILALPADIYFISALPIMMKATDFIFIIAAALVICLVATVYPARRAAALEPVEIIRFKG